MQQEIHPWNWYCPPGAKAIVIGTFPPTLRNWSYDFFYPNKNNYFWKIMAFIAEKELHYFSGIEAVNERKNILNHLGVGVSDMGKIIIRKSDSSLDQNLEIIEYMDIFQLLKENPSIRKIIFTSSSGKSSAIRWFKNYLALQGVEFKIPKGKRPLRTEIDIQGKSLKIVLLYSTSPLAGATIPYNRLVELFKNEVDITLQKYKKNHTQL
jgi:G:T/U-mismatch repair DNA glycosylase